MAIEIAKQHRTIGDMSKPAADIPVGVWQLRAISVKKADHNFTSRDGTEVETVRYTVVLEPVKPTASVDPAALEELDPATGKPAHDGKRIFVKTIEAFANQRLQMAAMLSAMGFTDKDDFDEIVASNAVKGKLVYGEVYNHSYSGNDGTQKSEQRVKSWSSAAAADALAI